MISSCHCVCVCVSVWALLYSRELETYTDLLMTATMKDVNEMASAADEARKLRDENKRMVSVCVCVCVCVCDGEYE